MLTKPKIEDRKEQSYVAIRTKVNKDEIPAALPPLLMEVYQWLGKYNIKPAGAPFFQYHSMNSNCDLEVNVGIPTQSWVEGEGRFFSGSFPPGVYATISHFGHYSKLMEAHMALENWIRENGWDDTRQRTENEVKWGGRTEFYITDPQTEPDPEKWQTDVVFSL